MPVANSRPTGWMPAVLGMLAICGYGVWLLLGLGLALGVYSGGRGDALVPLLLGAVAVSLGPLLASLRLPWLRGWRGWWIERGGFPSRHALLALVCYLPALGVAGLVRGDNDFWATRLISAALVVCSVACLACVWGKRRAPAAVGQFRRRLERVIAAGFGGGLWLLFCVLSQDPSVHVAGSHARVIGLLLLILLLGLVEGMRWQAVGRAGLPGHWRARFVSVTLTYVIPCTALLLHAFRDDRWPVLIAACAFLLGRSIEWRLRESR